MRKLTTYRRSKRWRGKGRYLSFGCGCLSRVSMGFYILRRHGVKFAVSKRDITHGSRQKLETYPVSAVYGLLSGKSVSPFDCLHRGFLIRLLLRWCDRFLNRLWCRIDWAAAFGRRPDSTSRVSGVFARTKPLGNPVVFLRFRACVLLRVWA